jgi:hypothetical protein
MTPGKNLAVERSGKRTLLLLIVTNDVLKPKQLKRRGILP